MTYRRILTLLLAGLVLTIVAGCKSNNDMDKKVEKLLSQLTLEEKISLIHGNTYFTTPAIPRLGIPALHMSDGPCGIREEISPDSWNPAGWKNDASAYFPALTSLAATWNPALSEEFGNAYAEEAMARGKDIMLAPGLNIHRTPLSGRNWEYFSEDPFLTGQMAVPFIKAAQNKGIIMCAKHFALNNQEKDRGSINVEVSDRALHEIYLPAFESVVKDAGVLAVMGAYNKFRGKYACQNPLLLNDILKKDWGFKGIVISDWGAAHNTVEAANAGLDIEMWPIDGKGNNYYMGQALLDSVKAGKVDPKVIDDKVRRILYVMVKQNLIGKAEPDTTGMAARLGTPAHAATALKIAEEAVILLKNTGKLPLDPGSLKSVAVIGDNATRKHAYGGESTTIKAKYEITPLEGLQKKLGKSVQVNVAQGYKVDKNLKAVDKALIAEAVAQASKSDVAIIFGGLNHEKGLDCEGEDKPDLKLPYGQDELISAVVKANPNTIVVLIAGTPVEMGPWLNDIRALLYTSYLGMETGTALANVITGAVNPSGKLPYTIPVKLEDSPDHVLGEYPGKDGTVNYLDDLMVGYRYYDSKKVSPLFPFGFGLSYTLFEYGNLVVNEKASQDKSNGVMVTFDIRNAGTREGSEVAEVYVRDRESSLPRPFKELKGFTKVSLKPGETKTVSVFLNRKAFKYYNPDVKDWVLESGEFTILVGPSSHVTPLAKSIKL